MFTYFYNDPFKRQTEGQTIFFIVKLAEYRLRGLSPTKNYHSSWESFLHVGKSHPPPPLSLTYGGHYFFYILAGFELMGVRGTL